MLNRRDFGRAVATTAGMAAMGWQSARGDEPTKTSPPGKFFDIHTHFGHIMNYRPALTITELLRWMDAHEIARAVVLPLVSPESSTFPLTSDMALAETKPHRDRLVPFCCIDPRSDVGGGQRGLLGILSRWVEAGAKGFGEHKAGVPIDDPRNMKIYEACAELKLPVLVHMDNRCNTDQPGLPALAKVLTAFPIVNFIGHAIGWWASISGDHTPEDFKHSPRSRPVTPGGAIDALMDKYPNIYGDLSATAGADAIRRDLKFGREFLIRRADRLLFGTDYHFPGHDIPQFEIYEELKLPVEVERKVFRENARKVLGV